MKHKPTKLDRVLARPRKRTKLDRALARSMQRPKFLHFLKQHAHVLIRYARP